MKLLNSTFLWYCLLCRTRWFALLTSAERSKCRFVFKKTRTKIGSFINFERLNYHYVLTRTFCSADRLSFEVVFISEAAKRLELFAGLCGRIVVPRDVVSLEIIFRISIANRVPDLLTDIIRLQSI